MPVAALLAQADKGPLIRWSWIGDHLDDILDNLIQHVALTIVTVVVGFAISMVLALVCVRWRFVFPPVNALTGIMYAIPSVALFILLTPITGLTTLTAEIALVSYTLQILVRAIVAGFDSVPDSVRESATGMGYTNRQRLLSVELPLALPVIIGGLRVATVTTVGLLSVAGVLGSDQGGLGELIFDGLNRYFNTPLLVGSALIVAVAVAMDLLLMWVERMLTPWAARQRAAA